MMSPTSVRPCMMRAARFTWTAPTSTRWSGWPARVASAADLVPIVAAGMADFYIRAEFPDSSLTAEPKGAVSDVIAVERELARLQTEIDQIEARLRLLRSSVAMSRVSLEIHRPRVLGPVGTVVAGAAWVVEKLFVIE